MTVEEIKAEMAKLPVPERVLLVDWGLSDTEVMESRRERLRREIQIGVDQIDRGEYAPLDMEATKRLARAEWEAEQKR